MEKKVKEELGLRGLEVDSIVYLVEHLEGEKWPDFLRARLGEVYSRFQTLFLRTLYSWSQVLNHDTEFTFLDFVNMIVVESLGSWGHDAIL